MLSYIKNASADGIYLDLLIGRVLRPKMYIQIGFKVYMKGVWHTGTKLNDHFHDMNTKLDQWLGDIAL